MLNHRHKRILIRVLLVKEMNFICPDAPSGRQNPWEFPKGINFNQTIARFRLLEQFSPGSAGPVS